MRKKILSLAVAALLSLSVFGLAGCGGVKGEFYTLDEAYENGWLTVEELQSIAYYYNNMQSDNGGDEPFTPLPINPPAISKENQKAIKKTYLRDLKRTYSAGMSEFGMQLKDVNILNYYGAYGNCIIVGILDSCIRYDLVLIPEYYIGGVLFQEYSGSLARVWKAK